MYKNVDISITAKSSKYPSEEGNIFSFLQHNLTICTEWNSAPCYQLFLACKYFHGLGFLEIQTDISAVPSWKGLETLM
jgi:hypothetical protein